MNKFTLILMAIFITPLIGYSQFVENKGQIHDVSGKFRNDVHFVIQFSDKNIFFTDKGIVHHYTQITPAKFDLIESGKIENPYTNEEWEVIQAQLANDEYTGDEAKSSGKEYRVDMTFPGANLSKAIGEKEIQQKNNYYLPNKTVRDAVLYNQVRYIDVYPGIDLVFYKDGDYLKYDFEVSPNAEPELIKILYKGIQGVELDTEGNIVVKVLPGEIIEQAPVSFQSGREIETKFQLLGDTITFQLSQYNKNQPITIDPALHWSTYFHDGLGSGNFTTSKPVWGTDGSMFYALNTYNRTAFPLINPGGSAYYNMTPVSTGLQIVIMKFDVNKQVVWATYYPSSQSSRVNFSTNTITIDHNDNIYVVGQLSFVYSSPAPAFGLFNPGGGAYYQTNIGTGRNFILKFSSTGQRLWATMMEPNTNSTGQSMSGLDIDSQNRLIVTGYAYTSSSWGVIPLANPGGSHYYRGSAIESQVPILYRFNTSLGLNWGTYISQGVSGSYSGGGEPGSIVKLDANDNIFIATVSSSSTYTLVNPGGGAYQDNTTSSLGRKIAIFKFLANGSLNWNTLYGGTTSANNVLWQDPRDMTILSNGDIVIAGYSNSTNFPTFNPGGGAYMKTTLSSGSQSVYDGIILQFSNNGVRKWATYYGGNGSSDGTDFWGIAKNANDDITIAGYSRTTNTFPIQFKAGSYNQSTQSGNFGAVLCQFNKDGVRQWSTYFGNGVYTRNHGFAGKDLSKSAGSCDADGVYLMFGVQDVTGSITTVNPGGGVYYQSAQEGTGQQDIIAEFIEGTIGGSESNTTSTNPICEDETKNLTTDGAGDGTWTIVSGGGSISGSTYTPGSISVPTSVTISYEDECGDLENVTFTVNPTPTAPVISSNSPICVGGTLNLTANTISGATYNWTGPNSFSSSAEDPTRSPVTAAMAGTYNSYVVVAGCTSAVASTNVTINIPSVAPTSITGTSTICSGASTTLTVSGGTLGTGATAQWYSGSCGGTLVGTGNSITVSPTSTTTYYVRYSGTCNTTSCASQTVTVNSNSTAPTSITGTTTICSGSSTTLTVNGGTLGTGATAQWYSGSCGGTLVGTGNSITVSPTSNTTYFVRYNGTCNTTTCISQAVTVNSNSTAPTSITGTSTICSGSSTTLTVTGGTLGTGATVQWYLGSCGGALINTGNSITVAPTSTTTYYVRYVGTCNTTVCISQTVTVTTPPNAGTLSGNQVICSGSTTTFSSTQAGGTWTSSNTGIATVNSSGVVTGQAAGTATITYTVTGTGGCSDATATRTVTVTAPPNAGTLSGTQAICEGSTTTFSSTSSGGTWSSSNTGTATVNSSGVVTGVSAGTAKITYTVNGTGGSAEVRATRTVTVTAPPNTGTLSGNQNVCEGSTTTFSSSVSGGTWSSSNTATATVNSSGVVTGQAAGTTTITYTVAGTSGCADATATRTVTVTAPPNTGTLSGNQNVCEGSTTTFSSSVSGGTWSSSNTATATVNSSGVVTGQAAGTATITYTVTGTGGCSDATTTRTVTVTAPPNAGTLSGTQAICEGSTTTFSTTSSGGTWSSSNMAIATVDGSGVITGLTDGTATITYTVTGTGGCSDATATRTVTVDPLPTVTIPSSGILCEGATLNVTPATGGTWASSDVSVATITNGGVVTGVSEGTADMVYTETATGCSSTATMGTITVDPLPTFTVSLTNPSSCGTTDGSITVSGLNPSTTYDVSIASGSLNSQTTNAAGEITFSGLGAGEIG